MSSSLTRFRHVLKTSGTSNLYFQSHFGITG
jgi:hypothetical protein